MRPAMIALLLFAACSTEAPPAQDPPLSGQVVTEKISCVDVAEHGLTFSGRTRAAIKQELGEPTRLQAGAGAGADSVFVMEYPGLRLSLHGSSGGELADEARISDNRYLTHPAAGIGAAADSIVALLGEPNSREDSALIYVCHSDAGSDDPITFLLAKDTVRELVYTWYMD